MTLVVENWKAWRPLPGVASGLPGAERVELRTIRKRILHGERMRAVAVQIDYEDWLETECLLGLEGGKEPADLREYEGAMRLTEDPVAYQRRLWEGDR